MVVEASPKSLVVDLGAVLISEVLGYVAFLLNVPFVVSLMMMLVTIVIVIQDVYGFSPLSWFPSWFPGIASRIPKEFEFHLHGEDILRLYARASFILFLIWEIVRVIFKLKRASFRRHLLTVVIVATLGWGFVLAHVPVMRVAPGSTRVSLAVVFFFLYLLGLGGFVLGSVIALASDALIDRLVALRSDD